MEQNEITIKKKSFLRECLEIIFFVAVIVIPIQTFVGRTFIVIGNSMFPTFENKDYLIVDKLSYHFKAPSRGDVIVFHPPINEKTYYIKRIIGLPGETIVVKKNEVTIINDTYPEGVTLEQPYASSLGESESNITLKTDEYFVMGDNRAVSSDSRAWGILPKDHISGRAFMRLYPFSHIDMWPGALEQSL